MKHFHPFRLDTVNECLWRGDERITLTPKAFAVGRHLIDHAGRLVTKEELMEAVWPDRYVGEENLKQYILELRRALGDRARNPSFIEMQRGRGYRFIAPVTEGEPALSVPVGDRRPRLLSGREAELEKLHGWYEQAARGARQVVFISGESGVGKTALVDAFVQEVAARGKLRVAAGQSIEFYREREAFYSVLEALGRLCREADGQPTVEVLGRFAPTWLVQFPALLTPERRRTLQHEILGATRERMLREICEALEALTAEIPLVLVLEDQHWADYSTLDFIAALARRRDPARLMVLATYRTPEVLLPQHPLRQLEQELSTHHLCRELPLGPLGEGAVRGYLATRFPGSAIPAQLAGPLHEQTCGKPLFMISAVNHLLSRGLITEDGGGAKLNATLDEVSSAVPESLQQFIEMQVERLAAEEQGVLAAASVAGVDFAAWAVAAATGRDVSEIEECCENLARRQLMLRAAGLEDLPGGPPSARYQFVHSLYRETLYRRSSPAARARIHQRIGEAMEGVWADSQAENASELAGHFLEARDYSRAARYLRLAAATAARRYAWKEAVALLESALEAAGRLTGAARLQARIEALEDLAAVQATTGERAQMIRTCETLAVLAAGSGRPEAEARALLSMSNELRWFDVPRALGACERAAEIGRDLDDTPLRIDAESRLNYLRLLSGWQREVAGALNRGVEWMRGAGQESHFARNAALYAQIQVMAGDYRDAERITAECRAVSSRVGDAFSHTNAGFARSWALMNLGRLGPAIRTVREIIATAERNVDAFSAAFCRVLLAWLHCEAFDPVTAGALCRSAEPAVRGMSAVFALPRFLVTTAMAETGLGNYDRAEECCAELRALYEGEPRPLAWYWQIPLRCALSELRLRRGETAAARREADALREFSRQNADRAWQARAAQVSAGVAIAERDYARAEGEIADALAVIGRTEAPLVLWRVHEMAAEFYRLTGRGDLAERHYRARDETLRGLADSFDAEEPLRRIMLRKCLGPGKSRRRLTQGPG